MCGEQEMIAGHEDTGTLLQQLCGRSEGGQNTRHIRGSSVNSQTGFLPYITEMCYHCQSVQ